MFVLWLQNAWDWVILKEEKCMLSVVRVWDIQDQGSGSFVVWWGSDLRFGGDLLAHSKRRRVKRASQTLYEACFLSVPVAFTQEEPLWVITFWRPDLLTLSPCQHLKFGGGPFKGEQGRGFPWVRSTIPFVSLQWSGLFQEGSAVSNDAVGQVELRVRIRSWHCSVSSYTTTCSVRWAGTQVISRLILEQKTEWMVEAQVHVM